MLLCGRAVVPSSAFIPSAPAEITLCIRFACPFLLDRRPRTPLVRPARSFGCWREGDCARRRQPRRCVCAIAPQLVALSQENASPIRAPVHPYPPMDFVRIYHLIPGFFLYLSVQGWWRLLRLSAEGESTCAKRSDSPLLLRDSAQRIPTPVAAQHTSMTCFLPAVGFLSH